jgi:hypothetical protein
MDIFRDLWLLGHLTPEGSLICTEHYLHALLLPSYSQCVLSGFSLLITEISPTL